tara:strand:- start:2951 stop:3337 length:387 start_codon:yes stop_codon:yes gene_type:complete
MSSSQPQSEAKNKTKAADGNGAAQSNGEASNMFLQNAGMTKLLGGSTRAMQHWAASGQELARFYSTRMQKDLSLMSALTSCKTPQDVSEVWYNAASSAVHDYADEFDRIMEIGLANISSDEAMQRRGS